MPLSALRDQSAELDSDVSYVVCCDTGRRSSAAAYILSERGFNASVLKGGLNQLAGGPPRSRQTDEGADSPEPTDSPASTD